MAIDHTRGNQAVLKWLLYDGHGNMVRTMAPDRMASDYTLSAWQFRGVWDEVQGTLGAGRGYCANLGHPEDETGLVYMRARYYEPATGRFISEDPARDGVNWYLYADGNPVNKVDADGERSEWLDKFNLLLELLIYLKEWGFPIPDPAIGAARLVGNIGMLGTAAGIALAGAKAIVASLAVAFAPAAALSLGLALAFCIAIIGLAVAFALAEMIDWAADPDLYSKGGSTFRPQ